MSTTNITRSVHNNIKLETRTTTRTDIEELICEWRFTISDKIKYQTHTTQLPLTLSTSPVFGGNGHSWKLQCINKPVTYFPVRDPKALPTTCLKLVCGSQTAALLSPDSKVKVVASFKKLEENSESQLEKGLIKTFEKFEAGYYKQAYSIATEVLLAEESGYLNGNVLTAYCKILISSMPIQLQQPTYTVLNSSVKRTCDLKSSSVVQAMKNLLVSSDFADIHLVTSGKSFPAHRGILAARSPVFSAMFRSNMLETKNRTVEIQDFDDIAVGAMLEYIYTGQAVNMKENAIQLLQISDKYQLLELKEECIEFLCSNLKMKDVADVLILARLFNASVLKAAAERFILENKNTVSKTKSFNNLAKSNPEILIEFFLAL